MGHTGRRACVIGAGNGGQAAAAHLGALGWDVSLYDIDKRKVTALRAAGRIRASGRIQGSVKPRSLTWDCGEALESAELILVTTTANAHYSVARACAPHLRGGETLLIMPGYFCGALVVSNGLRDGGHGGDVVVCDAESLYYACRASTPGSVKVTGLKPGMRIAAFPGTRTEGALRTLRRVFPRVRAASNILETAFNNLNPLFHPPITLLNTGWIEKTSGDFVFYPDGCTGSVARVIEHLDRERVALAARIGVRAEPCVQILRRWYGSRGNTIYKAIQATKAYHHAKAPDSLDARYIWEDIPMGLIPYASLAEKCGITVEAIRTIINLACLIMGVDYWNDARTMKALGLEGLDARNLKRFMEVGERV